MLTKMRVAIRSHDLEDAVVDRQKRDVEGSAAQIEHEDVLLAFLLVETVGDRSSSSENRCFSEYASFSIEVKLGQSLALVFLSAPDSKRLSNTTYGSLMILMTLSPAMVPASFVA